MDIKLLRPLTIKQRRELLQVPRGCKVFCFELVEKIRLINKDKIKESKYTVIYVASINKKNAIRKLNNLLKGAGINVTYDE